MGWASAASGEAPAEPVDGEWVPFLAGDLGGYAALALRHLGPRHTDALTPRQRRLAEALGSSTEPWLIDGQEFGNVAELVGGYGLPGTRAQLRAYLIRTP
jgi:hypothetical protein